MCLTLQWGNQKVSPVSRAVIDSNKMTGLVYIKPKNSNNHRFTQNVLGSLWLKNSLQTPEKLLDGKRINVLTCFWYTKISFSSIWMSSKNGIASLVMWCCYVVFEIRSLSATAFSQRWHAVFNTKIFSYSDNKVTPMLKFIINFISIIVQFSC